MDGTPEVQGADCHDVADQHWINGNLPCGGDAAYELVDSLGLSKTKRIESSTNTDFMAPKSDGF